MILEIENYYGETIGALMIERNNHGELDISNTQGNIDIADRDFDDIFGTNLFKTRIQLNTTNREQIANSIVDDIISVRKGEMYDEEILQLFTTEYFETEMEKVRNLVDEKMGRHLANDNLTIL